MKKLAAFISGAGGALTALPAAADEGLPQFNAALFPEQLFWLVISFALLYALMKYVALPSVQQTQDKRKNVIDSDLSAAKAANEQAKAMGHEADRAMADARAKANATISGIKTEASKLASEQQATQGHQLQQRLRDAEAAIAAKRDAALKEIDSAAAGLAAAIVEQVAGTKAKA